MSLWRTLVQPGIDLRAYDRSDSLLILSDYGGDAEYLNARTYSFLLCDPTEARPFLDEIRSLRKGPLKTSGEIAYKKYRAGRFNILRAFCDAALRLPGQLVTIAIDKHEKIEDLHPFTKALETSAPDFVAMVRDNYKEGDRLRAFRIADILAALLAAVPRPDQPVLWVTDVDDVTVNEKVSKFTTELVEFRAFCLGARRTTRIQMTHAKTCPGHPDARELLSIADIAAAGVAEVLSLTPQYEVRRDDMIHGTYDNPTKEKALFLLESFLRGSNALRHTILRVSFDTREGGFAIGPIAINRVTRPDSGPAA